MQVPRFYISNENLISGQIVSLDKRASQHLLRVLRARLGDAVVIFNGEGGEYKGKLTEIQQGNAFVELFEYKDVTRESCLSIHLLQGISRGERMDYVIQKASELGVATITPLFTERSVVKLSADRLTKRLDHWRSIVISASEQSGRCSLPVIRPAMSLVNSITKHQGVGFICDTESQNFLRNYPKLKDHVSLLIGPEGGFSDHEIQLAKDKGFHSLSLGPRILRTETAPVVAMSLLQGYGGDF